MAECDACGKRENMPYQCRHCGDTFCAEHRLPENHNCPGLDNWSDPGGVFDSGFDESVVTDESSSGGRVAEALGLGRPGGFMGYFRGNMTYVFLGLMWITFLVQIVLRASGQFGLERTLFALQAQHPEYVWTWVTSIFAHGGFGHIAANSFLVFFLGRIVEDYVGTRKFTALFLVSGALAGLAQISVPIALSLVETGGLPTVPTASVLGASGAGLAILGVLTALNPDMRVLLFFVVPVQLRILAGGIVVVSLLLIVSGINLGLANVAHLVGLGIGLLYGQRVKGQRRVPNQIQVGLGGRGPGGPGGPGGRGPF